MLRINEIIDVVQDYYPDADVSQIMKAYVFSAQVHAGQIRRSGEPYLSHPLAVAALMAEMRLDVASICAALLHDAVEDSNTTVDDVAKLLGREVAELVDGVTKISKIEISHPKKNQADSLRKMILAMAKDIRVLLLKLADRLHNMRTLGFMPEDKQKSVAQETLDIYAPMAHRLGIHRWQTELEDLALYYLKPEVYRRIKDKVASSRADREEFINSTKEVLAKLMADNGIKCRISGRPKHFYSIYLKTIRQKLDVDQLYDLIAFRIIVEGGLKDCYEALGVVHSTWRPVPGRFRDYIGMPKSNMYQSLHATVLGPTGQRMEVQIRTEEMHRVAEEGIAAHWQYKENSAASQREGERFAWLRQLLDSQKETDDPSEFLRSLRMDLYPEEIFVFTPQGDVKELPRGSTPLDFAYSIHTEVGHKTVGAKVNGRMVPLRYELHTGDQVEVITSPSGHPSKDWLKYVASGRARTRISSYIREEERHKSQHLGRDLLDRELRKNSLTVNGVIKDGRLQALLPEFNVKDFEQLFAAIAYARVTPKAVLQKLAPRHEPQPAENKPQEQKKRKPSGAIKVKGVDDVLTRFARCCTPLPGEPITGYITRGRGVSVHRLDCPALAEVEQERLLDVEWDDSVPTVRPVRLQIEAQNYAGVLADVAQALKVASINIQQVNSNRASGNHTHINLVVELKDAEQLKQISNDLRAITNVLEVTRASL